VAVTWGTPIDNALFRVGGHAYYSGYYSGYQIRAEDVAAFHDAQYARREFYECARMLEVRPLTPEEQAIHNEQTRRYERVRQEAVGAETKALALLNDRLGMREAALFKRTGKLMRPSTLWHGVEYLIPGNGHDMIQVIKSGKEQTRLCVVAGEGEPWPDRVMAILDLIESGQERRLWEMANVFNGHGMRADLLYEPLGHSLLTKVLGTLAFVMAGGCIGLIIALLRVWLQ